MSQITCSATCLFNSTGSFVNEDHSKNQKSCVQGLDIIFAKIGKFFKRLPNDLKALIPTYC